MAKDEALKQALEALDIVKIHFTQNRHVNEAITAIKEALAQPEHIGFMDSKLNPIQRTWVGLTPEQEKIYEDGFLAGQAHLIKSSVHRAVNRMAQRPWVGLTDEEIDHFCHLAYTGDEELVLTIQAKLKEKNNG